MDSSRGVSKIGESISFVNMSRDKLTGVNSMQIIQIRGEAKSFNGPFNILLDMGGRIGHSSLAKDIKTTL